MMQNTSELLDRTPPSDLDAERAVLGSILLKPACLDDIAQTVSADDFYSESHGRIFSTCKEMRQSNGQIDTLTLADRLEQDGTLGHIGGTVYLAELATVVPIASNSPHYARIVRERAERRRTLSALEAGIVQAYDQTKPIKETISSVGSALDAVERCDDRPTDSQTAILETLRSIDREAKDKSRLTRIGIHAFDRQYGGVGAGELCIMAARPGVGKSALALLIAEHVSVDAGPVLFVSLEMSIGELTRRRLCAAGGLDAGRMRRGELDDQEKAKMREAATALSDRPLHIWTPSDAAVTDIEREGRRRKRSDGLALLIVDYLSLLRPADPRARRIDQVGQLSRDLKTATSRLDVPVLALCQLNREADRQEPRLSHLRESGSIEQDADLVMFIHREADDEDELDRAKLIVAKHRHGETGDYKLCWDIRTATFSDPAKTRKKHFDFGD